MRAAPSRPKVQSMVCEWSELVPPGTYAVVHPSFTQLGSGGSGVELLIERTPWRAVCHVISAGSEPSIGGFLSMLVGVPATMPNGFYYLAKVWPTATAMLDHYESDCRTFTNMGYVPRNQPVSTVPGSVPPTACMLPPYAVGERRGAEYIARMAAYSDLQAFIRHQMS